MKAAFYDEWSLIFKSIWFWVGSGVYFLAESFYQIQKDFDGGVLHYYQYSFNAQYVVVIAVMFVMAHSYFAAGTDADISRFSNMRRLWGQVAADSLAFILMVFAVSFTKFLIGESLNGGFEDAGVALFCTGCYFYFFFLKTVFLIVAAALVSRCFYTIIRRMSFSSIIIYSLAAFLSLPISGVYADMIHSVLENKLAGSYAEALASEANETHFILTFDVLMAGLFAITVILLFFLFTLKMTSWVFKKDVENFENCHYITVNPPLRNAPTKRHRVRNIDFSRQKT